MPFLNLSAFSRTSSASHIRPLSRNTSDSRKVERANLGTGSKQFSKIESAFRAYNLFEHHQLQTLSVRQPTCKKKDEKYLLSITIVALKPEESRHLMPAESCLEVMA